MAIVTVGGSPQNTIGNLPEVGSKAPDFNLTTDDMSDKGLADFEGKKLVFNIFTSIDTSTCANSVRRFNAEAADLGVDVTVLCISRDLPFAQSRFCGSEGIDRVVNLSSMKDDRFGSDYGITFTDGPVEGLFSRSVIVTDNAGTILYTQQVAENADEPDYESALTALK